MGSALSLRSDFDGARLRRLARQTRGRMAHVQQSRGSRKHHHPATAGQITRAEPGRKHLAVHEGQLALKPRLQVLRGYRRPLLLRLENTAGSTMEDHVDRKAKMGTRVLINDGW